MAERERSPNYPAHGLPVAVEFIKSVYAAVKRVPVTQEAIGRALGSENLSGPARSKIAALNHYGLLDRVGNGDYKVSDRAIALIFRKPGDPEFEQAAKDAAISPPLFADLLQEKAGMDDALLRFHLMRDRKFSEDGAKRVIKSFRETLAFANLSDESYTLEDVPSDLKETAVTATQLPVARSTGAVPLSALTASALGQDLPVQRAFSLPNDFEARVSLSGKPTKEALEELAFLIKRWASYISAPTSPTTAESSPLQLGSGSGGPIDDRESVRLRDLEAN